MVKTNTVSAGRKETGFFFKTVVLFLFCVIIIFMRIDRLLCELNMGSRSQVKELIKKGLVSVDGNIIRDPKQQVDKHGSDIVCDGISCRYRPYVYYLMNKPAGVVSATCDERDKTVVDVLLEQLKEKYGEELKGISIKDIFPVGRLDKDTVGLMLLTNDGELAHKLLSPKKHVPKKYYVELNAPLTEEMAECLRTGVDIGEEKKTKPAEVEILTQESCYITLTEGKFHQVKRMFQSVGLTVVYLKRISMGNLVLNDALKEGCIRKLSEKEVENIC